MSNQSKDIIAVTFDVIMNNILSSLMTEYDSTQLINITPKLKNILEHRWTTGLTLSQPLMNCTFTCTVGKYKNTLQIEPAEHNIAAKTRPRYFLIDFTDETLWQVFCNSFVRIVIGMPSVSRVPRDIYIPLFRQMYATDDTRLQRLEIFDSVFTQHMLTCISGIKLKELLLTGFTHDQCNLMLNFVLEKFAVSIVGKLPLILDFSVLKSVHSVFLGGAISYTKMAQSVTMSIPDLYTIIKTDNTSVMNLILMVDGIDLVVNTIDIMLAKFPVVNRVGLCLDNFGDHIPICRRQVHVRNDFSPMMTISPSDDGNTVRLNNIFDTLDSHKIRHMVFDYGFVTKYMVNLNIKTIADKFSSMELEYICIDDKEVGRRLLYPTVFGDTHDDISVWTWDYRDITIDKGNIYPQTEYPSRTAITDFSFVIPPEPIFRGNFYYVVNRKNSKMTLPRVAKPVSKADQKAALIKPTKSFFSFS